MVPCILGLIGCFIRFALLESMRPIDIIFCQIWDRKSIKSLRASELGAFVALCHACLVEGFDPLPADKATLQVLARVSPQQWQWAEKRVIAALEDALGILRAAYEEDQGKQETRRRVARIASYAARAGKNLSENLTAMPIEFSSQDESLSGISQPLKATNFSSNKTDLRAREQAKSAQKQAKVSHSPLTD